MRKSATTASIAAAAVLLLLHTVLRDLPAIMQVVAIWAYLLAPHALERLDVWSPEGLYLPIGAVALAALWWWWRAPTRRSAFQKQAQPHETDELAELRL